MITLLAGRNMASILLAGAVAVAIGLSGCSGGGPTASVKGKVTADGQPVTEGTVTLTPASGNEALPSMGAVNADGSFEMAIPGGARGAAVGKNQVTYSPPPPVGEWSGEGADNRQRSKFEGYRPKEAEIEVKSGGNDVTIELVKQ
jgi:hypothetical protein